MTSSPASSNGQGKIANTDSFFVPVLAVSIAIAIFAFVTQCLVATGAISLSTTQQLMMWLVAAGLIVLLWIAYMAIQGQTRMAKAFAEATAAAQKEAAEARETARAEVARAERAARAAEQVAADAQRGRDDTVVRPESRAGEPEPQDAWVPPDELKRLDGRRQPVNTKDVFPDGCYLDSIREETDISGEVVDINRQRVYRCVVVDRNLTQNDRPNDTVVIIMADQEPSLLSAVGHPLVEFDGLTITPYVTNRSPIRMGYALRATGIKLALGQARKVS